MQHSRDQHLFGPGPKRILSLDGGGVRGAITLAFLERLEEVLGEIEGRPVRLGDWFDLIGGTSTGAIIATALSLGYSAREVRDFYMTLGPKVFGKARSWLMFWRAKFDSAVLAAELERVIGDQTFDSERLRTGLCILTKRVDTGSSWIIMNNPRSKFWDTPADASFIGNRGLPLAKVVRASTAAPHFFDPELIDIADGVAPGLFVDGGLTPHNNPALMLFLLSALPQYGLQWSIGPEQLMIVSVGTGRFRPTLTAEGARRIGPLGLAFKTMAAQIAESQQLTLTLMSWLGETATSWPINSEIGSVAETPPPFGTLFRFLRYDLMLDQTWLNDTLGAGLSEDQVQTLRLMDEADNIPTGYELGRRAAALQIRPEHFRRRS